MPAPCYSATRAACSAAITSHRVAFSSSIGAAARLHRRPRHGALVSQPRAPLAAIITPLRVFSQQVNEWTGKLAYGSELAPFFGSRGNAFSAQALATRQLYCKALVCASGGSRSARDWLAGCTALCSPNNALLYIALQYTATEADLWQLRAALLDLILDREDEKEAVADASTTASRVGDGTHQSRTCGEDAEDRADTQEESSPSDEEVLAAESYLLSHSPEVRCFLLDAMTASLFNARLDNDNVEQSRQRIFSIGTRVFGTSCDVLTSLWRVAQADVVIRKEKQRVFSQARID